MGSTWHSAPLMGIILRTRERIATVSRGTATPAFTQCLQLAFLAFTMLLQGGPSHTGLTVGSLRPREKCFVPSHTEYASPLSSSLWLCSRPCIPRAIEGQGMETGRWGGTWEGQPMPTGSARQRVKSRGVKSLGCGVRQTGVQVSALSSPFWS